MGGEIEAGFKEIEPSKQSCTRTCSGYPTCRMRAFPSPRARTITLRISQSANSANSTSSPSRTGIWVRRWTSSTLSRGVKLSGSRYYTLKGWGARLQRALISFFLDTARQNGYTEVYLPYIVHGEMLFGAAQFPKFQDTVFALADEENI